MDTLWTMKSLLWTQKVRIPQKKNINFFLLIFRFYSSQKINSKTTWRDSDTLADITTNELVVSGVYLRLYVSNPGWTLRKPKQFLSDLLDFVVENINRTGVEKEVLDISTKALTALLATQPNLADSIPVLGHIPKFFRQLSVQPNSALTVLHQLSLSEVDSFGFFFFWIFF